MNSALQGFVLSLDPLWQWFGIIIISAIPFVESYAGAGIGVLVGIAPPIAIAAAIVGNWLTMFLAVVLGQRIHLWRTAKSQPMSAKKLRIKKMFDKYGVPGVSLLGQLVAPSQFTAMAMVSFGAHKGKVLFWETISITLEAILFGVLVSMGVNMLDR